ncbi:uncharacterized protein CTRU02_202950 [Colletotrichum truncatum]|uniref:Uncharacterized protein n=1 Tax=Colletotrichum truncatum TaxID=5467 RepID=A0ACC3Z7W7_COLTU|nr:uncharacterized protein CTRU02_13229 [Colletotrichum truncatum]KAF6783721.1 hypothetical protein CTRU02_13229 [Colletotrichum truncatum]
MHSLPNLWNANDDWTGITSRAERKKRQNRLNQRAWHVVVPPSKPHEYEGALILTKPEHKLQVLDLIKKAYQDYTLQTPQVESLHMLVRLNTLNAFARNADHMGLPWEGLCEVDLVSPFNRQSPSLPGCFAISPNCPASLQPTSLQQKIIHHPWIDLLPFPQMKNNILLAIKSGLLDEDDLCDDILEVWVADKNQRPSLITWGESSNTMAWEISLPFLRKWGWLLAGCRDIFEATNYWRERRGQAKINFEKIQEIIANETSV